uniref:Uncharacterized protein n=1 Tax=Eutreptiella gymnastica TaxID=73025 RepID=A0A7S4FTS1_9EUGL
MQLSALPLRNGDLALACSRPGLVASRMMLPWGVPGSANSGVGSENTAVGCGGELGSYPRGVTGPNRGDPVPCGDGLWGSSIEPVPREGVCGCSRAELKGSTGGELGR